MMFSIGKQIFHLGQQAALTEMQKNYTFALVQTCAVTSEDRNSQGCLSYLFIYFN